MNPCKVLPILAMVILLGSCVVIWFYPPTGDYRVDNPSWNGFSELNKATNAESLGSLTDLPSSGAGTALIVVPYSQYSQEELSLISRYVASGGTLILMDDYGSGNQVLGGLGLDARFSGQTLLDPLYNYKNKNFPTITDFASTSANVNVSSVILNHATHLTNVDGMTVIAYSSTFSFSDGNGDGTYDSDEITGSLPVVAYTKSGQGYVVVVSDPSLAINGMINLDDNSAFMTQVLSIGGGNPQIYIDQSHLQSTALDQSKAVLATVYSMVASPLGTLTLIVVVLAYSLNRFWKRGKQ
ncbi:MAG TPA: DUF4350 domain-containing protein [Candidatus Acidoferrales bacterium]|nr:DUF4350 domain-containing protein [Candidatus Acidoferrales bacterium]